MLEDILPTLIILIAFLVFAGYIVKKISEVLKTRMVKVAKGKEGSITSKLPDSLYELFNTMEQALDLQVQTIAEKCNKEGKNPMDDTGYKTVLSQYDRVKGLREKFENNPMYIMVDAIGWPMVKSLIPDAMTMAKRFIKGFA